MPRLMFAADCSPVRQIMQPCSAADCCSNVNQQGASGVGSAWCYAKTQLAQLRPAFAYCAGCLLALQMHSPGERSRV
jgi:hypothetical protein